MGAAPPARPAPTGTSADAQRSIVDGFRYLENRTERDQYFPPFPETKRIEANRLHGRQAAGSA